MLTTLLARWDEGAGLLVSSWPFFLTTDTHCLHTSSKSYFYRRQILHDSIYMRTRSRLEVPRGWKRGLERSCSPLFFI